MDEICTILTIPVYRMQLLLHTVTTIQDMNDVVHSVRLWEGEGRGGERWRESEVE